MKVRHFKDPEFGDLGVLEFDRLPFGCKRAYWVGRFDDGVVRGNHAHKTLNQVFIVLQGEVEFTFFRGTKKSVVTLTEQDDYHLVLPGIWRTFQSRKPGSVLLVFCDQEFREEDYIRNWEDYLDWYQSRDEG